MGRSCIGKFRYRSDENFEKFVLGSQDRGVILVWDMGVVQVTEKKFDGKSSTFGDEAWNAMPS